MSNIVAKELRKRAAEVFEISHVGVDSVDPHIYSALLEIAAAVQEQNAILAGIAINLDNFFGALSRIANEMEQFRK